MKKHLVSIALTAILGIGVNAHAATLNTTTATPNDGVLLNFTGIDWNSNGGAWIQGFGLSGANTTGDSDAFTLTYQAFAGTIQTTSPTPNLYVASPGTATGSYELTTYAVLNETATCMNVGCSSISISTNPGGSWQIYFDTSPDANQAAGTGFRDALDPASVVILSGNFTGGLATFTATGPVGPGSLGTGGGFLFGEVLVTNLAYVNPKLAGTTVQTSLQFPGQATPTYTRPAAFDGVATGADSQTDFVIQADSSQNFTVPEPATLLLMGIGMLGMGFTGRRKKQ